MKKTTLLSLLIPLLIIVPEIGADLDKEWINFKNRFNRHYDSDAEEQYRKEIFAKNLAQIMEHNRRAGSSFTMDINQFSDMTQDEFSYRIRATGLAKTLLEDATVPMAEIDPFGDNDSLPEEVDWTKKNAVTPVKNQGSCGSCWAFCVTGAIEGAHALATKKLISLSEQHLIDCDKSNYGCMGGNPLIAYRFVKNNGGIDTEQSYPYEAEDKECRDKEPGKIIGANITGYFVIESGNEMAMKQKVANGGPISVAINADCPEFRNYRSGVIDKVQCGNQFSDLNHGVLIVGYGKANISGQEISYWKVKNSWGIQWGDNGYVLMKRDVNLCGIALFASFPVV